VRADVSFNSGGDDVAAWLYGSSGSVCVVMAHGFSLTRHDGLEPYAEAFADAGLRALAFDHRYLGDSGGLPRQSFTKAGQLEDWRNAIEYARRLDGVDPERIVLWGYSFSGGHVTTIAARDTRLAAALVLCPFVNGVARVLSAPPKLTAWLLPIAVTDLAGRVRHVPVTGPPGSHSIMSLPGEADGFAAAVAPNSPWQNEMRPGVFVTVPFHRPLARAGKIGCPLWVGLGERDVSVDKASAVKLAERAPRGELHRYDYDHFGPFHGEGPATVVADQVDFLRRQGLAPAAVDHSS
jgi:pimeloyl-ACP methyl ester carboxylesterase